MATIEKLKNRKILLGELKIYISQLFLEILKDPDFGLDLRDEVKEKLERVRKNKVRFFSEEEIKKRLNF